MRAQRAGQGAESYYRCKGLIGLRAVVTEGVWYQVASVVKKQQFGRDWGGWMQLVDEVVQLEREMLGV